MKNLICLILLFIASSASAHFGSPDVVYQGNAGPYEILVTIQPPDVVPGIAKILINFKDQNNIKLNKVIIQPVYYQYGSEGAPQGDRAMPVPGQANSYQGELWLMTFGSSSVKISIEGNKGAGSTIVPVPAIATATREMDSTTEVVLSILGVFLLISFVTIIGASLKEATLKPGVKPSNNVKRKAAIVMIITGVLIGTGLFFASKWWNKVEGDYRKNMFKPLIMNSEIITDSTKNYLKLTIENQPWLNRVASDFVEDHGKIMHLFLINNQTQNFAHLHPVKSDSTTLISPLPPLEKGNYTLFAEVVHANGMAETMTDTLQIDRTGALLDLETDDFAGKVFLENKKAELPGLQIVAVNSDNLSSGTPVEIQFECLDTNGQPAKLQPYLGMAGHAAVMKEDATVFIHLHPMGTVSMASQLALAAKVDENVTICGSISDSTIAGMDSLGLADKKNVSIMRRGSEEQLISGKLTFPYQFPKPGNYLVWVQVKHEGKIKTAGFKFTVN